jgi:hypothetical protein
MGAQARREMQVRRCSGSTFTWCAAMHHAQAHGWPHPSHSSTPAHAVPLTGQEAARCQVRAWPG